MTDSYVLGRSAEEYERLRAQARMWEPETARLLDHVGVGPGARCLDAGCGAGDGMRLMAERGASVLGVDVDAELGAQAVDALHADGHDACAFAELDIEHERPDGSFDVVLARLLLIHVDDPAAVLRRLWDCVAPGGHLVVQDYDLLTGQVLPGLESMDEFRRVAIDAFLCAGRDVRLGMRLPALHREAGIGPPDGIDVGARVGLLPELAPLYEAVHRSVLPGAVAHGLTNEARSEQWRKAFARDCADGDGHAALWPLLFGTYKRKAEA
jgi:SAM-dependent methyltransferase